MTVAIITHNAAIAPMADKVIEFKNGQVEKISCVIASGRLYLYKFKCYGRREDYFFDEWCGKDSSTQ